jgi:hypothetical protein
LLVAKLEHVYLVLVPDRVRVVGDHSKLIGRRYAYQILLIEEFARPVSRPCLSARDGDNSRESPVATVLGHDRGVPAGADPRTFVSR